ncbi:MAG: glycoside hydrolase family 3 protein [Bacteroidetes bacterium]|nr:MAG: glycoside hydrolase family 3 protein [Bacteroidota bacterium]
MKKLLTSLLLFLPLTLTQAQTFSLADFYTYQPELNEEVEAIFDQMNDTTRVGQLIIQAAGRLGIPKAEIVRLIQSQKIGGVLLLKGEKDEFTRLARELDSISLASGGLPLLFSADAEPSLFNSKIKGTAAVKKTNQIQDAAECRQIASLISEELKTIGIHYNFAPVVDVSPFNEAIGNRSFGSDAKRVVELCAAFIGASQRAGVAATAKHFPGHGLVKGDTHHKLVYIDGDMQEVANYQPLIDSGLISIMVAHIAVENNPHATQGQPASISREIVTGLLKEEMGFRGLVVTDAMRMGAIASIPHASLKAVEAGCDLILMPLNEEEMVADILAKMEEDPAFKRQVYISVKKVLRLKLCLGVLKPAANAGTAPE